MSDVGLDLDPAPESRPPARGGRRRKKNRTAGCLAALVALAVIVGGFYFVVTKGVAFISDQFGEADDYPGPGGDPVVVEVRAGDSTAAIGRTLKDADVVASVTAFTTAAQAEPEVAFIQPGHYEMLEQMAARDAVAVLIDPDNIVRSSVTIPEGYRLTQIVDRLAESTDFRKRDFRAILDQPGPLELPDYAEGEPEGYLFPATYDFPPGTEPLAMLKAMVDRFKQVAEETGLADAASAVDLSVHDAMTVASIIEKEVNRAEDLPEVAAVIRNRLDGSCAGQGVPEGLLQMDSTVHFIAGGGTGSVFTTSEARESDSPYNTYRSRGLPPGPISSPGQAAIEAVLNPSDAGYCYFVAVDLDTGETAFAETEGEHNANRAKLADWCRENAGRC